MKRPKTVLYLSLGVATVRRLATPQKGREFRSVFADLPPELTPTHLGYARDSRRFDLHQVEEQLSAHWNSARGGDVLFAYRGRLKGSFHLHALHLGPGVLSNYLTADFEAALLDQRELFRDALALFENLTQYADACYGYAMIRSDHRGGHWYRDYSPQSLDCNGIAVPPGFPPRLTLQCLPPFVWLNVLGREYIDLLGREKLMTLDVFDKRFDDAGRLWLQVTERPEQMYPPETVERVEAMIAQLDAPDVFCREPRTEEENNFGIKTYRTPDFDRSEIRTTATPGPPPIIM